MTDNSIDFLYVLLLSNMFTKHKLVCYLSFHLNYYYCISLFSVHPYFIESGSLTVQFNAIRRCKQPHRVAYIHFTIPIHHVYGFSCRRSEVNGGQGFRGHPVYFKNYQFFFHYRKLYLFHKTSYFSHYVLFI